MSEDGPLYRHGRAPGFAQVAVLEDGLVRDEGRIGATPEALRAFADGSARRDEVALEATGNT